MIHDVASMARPTIHCTVAIYGLLQDLGRDMGRAGANSEGL